MNNTTECNNCDFNICVINDDYTMCSIKGHNKPFFKNRRKCLSFKSGLDEINIIQSILEQTTELMSDDYYKESAESIVKLLFNRNLKFKTVKQRVNIYENLIIKLEL